MTATIAMPQSLIGLDRARQRFGAGRVERLVALATPGDPLANAAFAEIAARATPPTAYRQTAQALQHPDLPQVTEPASP